MENLDIITMGFTAFIIVQWGITVLLLRLSPR